MVNRSSFNSGDPVIYRVCKRSTHPGRRAQEIIPASKGDDYSYQVDKFWIVSEIRSDGKLLLRTRRGKAHLVNPDDPMLRHAHWWERWLYRKRFPDAGLSPEVASGVS